MPSTIIPSDGIRIVLALVGMVLAIGWPRVAPRWRSGLLAILVVVGVANYHRWDLASATRFVDVYDLVHYYTIGRSGRSS